MKPPRFQYWRPLSLRDAVTTIGQLGHEALPLAGGQSLVPMLNMRLARPQHLVDLNFAEELAGYHVTGETLVLGATVRIASLMRPGDLSQAAPLVALAAAHVGHPAIRNRGTIGGSIAHADPAAELPLILCVLQGNVRVVSAASSRIIEVLDLFGGPFTTSLKPGELITEVRVPLARPGQSFGFAEFARRLGDFAIVGAACALHRDASGQIDEARIGVAGVGPTPAILGEVGSRLLGTKGDEQTVEKAASSVGQSMAATSDIHGSADYRRALAIEMVRRAVAQALSSRN